ncbi:2-succinyl-5-enolpyruvyl-6-hydroxy-3-cyclohexene-1-carboxylic-acid synthase [Bacillus massilinigeriensis]|uniref:2-succinyl-5-enolpyruvyl-6-hydroxy-3- cyclohexene-1-carboxylic-acid synthase n=1 Tax=Bacillus mediterraneensis TaxID=1805474 RepID=UPI0008F844AE|nr:2-succinyl-5-enolpyruvyl-6-hydroxy-3-cyclohexene-1-carboxylic-acid synthase [Bacillus mediterraneensis]
MSHIEALTAYLSSFVAELAISGVRDVVISPGSRSTPIAMVMAEHPELQLHIHVDERSAAFFALGIAKASGKPVALLCTSGTAAANYYPAIVEAGISRVPLIVITADRPHELRDVGAPQAIDQIHLYGHNVKWFVEMAIPEASSDARRYARTVCARAAATAKAFPAGPVHLNFPLREPLIPNLHDEMFELEERPEGYIQIVQGSMSLPDSFYESLIEELPPDTKGIIVCGPIEDKDFSEAVVLLARTLGFPILADPLSQLRSGVHDKSYIIDGYDTFLRNEAAKTVLKPDVVLRFGAMPVSKALSLFLKENRQAMQIVVDGGNGWRDPLMSASRMVYASETQFCLALSDAMKKKPENEEYLERWKQLNARTNELLAEVEAGNLLSEAKLFQLLKGQLPENATIFVGNSMPIRDLDTFFTCNGKNIKVLANRGANGIDGVISSAMGAAVINDSVYLILGDLTFFHDTNGLLPAKMENLHINIILINNNGGGIFSFLPQANHPKHFERLFGTPVDLKFQSAAEMYGASYDKITDKDEFLQAFEKNKIQKGLNIMEVVTDREANLQEHRNLWKNVSREIDILLEGETL